MLSVLGGQVTMPFISAYVVWIWISALLTLKSFLTHISWSGSGCSGPAPTRDISLAHAVPYTVRSDETFYQIAKAHGVTMKQLLQLNPNTVTVAQGHGEARGKGKLGRVVMLREGQSVMVPADTAPLAWKKLLCGRARCAASAAKQHLGTFSAPRCCLRHTDEHI